MYDGELFRFVHAGQGNAYADGQKGSDFVAVFINERQIDGSDLGGLFAYSLFDRAAVFLAVHGVDAEARVCGQRTGGNVHIYGHAFNLAHGGGGGIVFKIDGRKGHVAVYGRFGGKSSALFVYPALKGAALALGTRGQLARRLAGHYLKLRYHSAVRAGEAYGVFLGGFGFFIHTREHVGAEGAVYNGDADKSVSIGHEARRRGDGSFVFKRIYIIEIQLLAFVERYRGA